MKAAIDKGNPAARPQRHPSTKNSLRLKRFLPVVSLIIFCVGIWVLHRELAGHDIAEVIVRVLDRSPSQVALAIGFTVASYALLVTYDALALHFIGKSLPLIKIATTSFVSFAVSLNLGAAVLTGGSLRLRLYSAAGLTALEVATVVAFLLLATGLGLGTMMGMTLLIETPDVVSAGSVPVWVARASGASLLAFVLAYFALVVLRRQPLRLFGYEIRLPNIRITLAQLLISVTDIGFAASVLYVLLPAETSITYVAFLGLFVFGSAIGTLSQVPGGVGVFEAAMLLLMPTVPADALLAAILAYRVIYFILPLIAAGGLLAWLELRGQSAKSLRLRGSLSMARFMAPQLLGTLTFLTGVLLLLSGATPAVATRIAFLRGILPLSLVEVSHLLSSALGFALLILGRGLYRRLNAAWWATVVVLATGVVLSLAKGWDYEEATALAVVLMLLLPVRHAFYRRASLMSPSLTPGWLAAISTAVLASLWVGAASFQNVELSTALWLDFTFAGDASRFVRGSIVVGVAAACFAFWRLMQGAAPRFATADAKSLKIARQIVAGSPEPEAKLALTGDKQFLFSDSGRSMIMFGVAGRSWISMGDPIGPKEEWEGLIWRFRELSDRHDGRMVFYQVGEENLGEYADIGLALLKVGEEAVVRLSDFSLQGSSRAKLRQAMNRAERDGVTFEVTMPPHSTDLVRVLRGVSDQWLADKNAAEKGFSVGRFSEECFADQPLAIIKVAGRIVAFANVWTGQPGGEFSIDLMRYSDEAPDGVMDFLFVSLFLWGKANGYTAFTLGMAPLSGLAEHPLAPTWQRIGAAVFRHGEYFYNFEGLRNYKEKFDPEWKPKYIAAPPGLALPRVLLDVTRLISGGVRGLVAR